MLETIERVDDQTNRQGAAINLQDHGIEFDGEHSAEYTTGDATTGLTNFSLNAPMHTQIKAIRVPSTIMSAISPKGTRPAMAATITPFKTMPQTGLPLFTF